MRCCAKTATPRATSTRAKSGLVRTIGQFSDLKHLEDTIIATQDGHSVYVPISPLCASASRSAPRIRQFGDPTVGFGVVRRTGANTVEVMKGVKRGSPI